MIMGWRTVYEISSEREDTKRGKKHLTPHGLEVLENRTEHDSAVLVQAMLKNSFGLLRI